MSVLIEAITVLVPLERLSEAFDDGLDAYKRIAPNCSLRADEHLTALSLTTPEDVASFIDKLETFGLKFLDEGKAIDIAVVDQTTGPTTDCDWLEFASDENGPSTCWKKGTEPGEMVAYDDWTYENSLGSAFQHLETREIFEEWAFVRQTDLGTLLRHKETGDEALLSSQYWSENEADSPLSKLAEEIQGVLEKEATRFDCSKNDAGSLCWFFEIDDVAGLISCEENTEDIGIPTVTLMLPLADTEDLSREDLLELLSRNAQMFHAALTCTSPFETESGTQRLLAIQHRFATHDFNAASFLEYVETLQFNAVTFLPELFDEPKPTIH